MADPVTATPAIHPNGTATDGVTDRRRGSGTRPPMTGPCRCATVAAPLLPVASSLGLKRASDARAAFLRALARQPDTERQRLRQRELERLDKLEARIRDRDSEQPEKRERRLAGLARMRETLP